MIKIMFNIYETYDKSFIDANLMGPNSMRLTEELSRRMNLKSGMRVLDLGCGKGLSSIFLAREYDVTVFATDLWIPAAENFERFKQMKLDDKIIPIYSEAHALPYADEFFDAVISVDAYHYFGTNERYLSDSLLRHIKKGAEVAIAVPGFTHELTDAKYEELSRFNENGELQGFHGREWWVQLWKRSKVVDVEQSFELECNAVAWEEWLNCGNPIGAGDREFYHNVKQLTTIGIIAKRNNKNCFIL